MPACWGILAPRQTLQLAAAPLLASCCPLLDQPEFTFELMGLQPHGLKVTLMSSSGPIKRGQLMLDCNLLKMKAKLVKSPIQYSVFTSYMKE